MDSYWFSTILIVYFARINYYHYGMFGIDETWSARDRLQLKVGGKNL